MRRTAECWSNIAKVYKGQEIHVALDNASYQRCKTVQMVAERLKIDLVFLPPYSPNLNLIERFWKFTKRELRTKFYSNFKEFCEGIDAIFASSDGEKKVEVNSLIGKKIQLFDDLEAVNDNYSEQRQKETARNQKNPQVA